LYKPFSGYRLAELGHFQFLDDIHLASRLWMPSVVAVEGNWHQKAVIAPNYLHLLRQDKEGASKQTIRLFFNFANQA
jgi:hypothetical protein